MNTQTESAVSAILATDATITKSRAAAALRLLRGEDTPSGGRLLRTTETARMLGVTTKTLRAWASAGAIRPVYAPGRKLRAGYTEESVRAFIEGRKAAEA